MFDYALGTTAALATILWVRWQFPRSERRQWAIALAVAALIYLGLAAAGSAGRDWLAIETVGLAVYGALAWLGLKVSPWLLALGWLAHVAWDIALHGSSTPFVPGWYPGACLAFDVIVAVYLAARCHSGALGLGASPVAAGSR